MSDFIGVVTNIGQAKIAGAIGGTALNLTTIRVGDGNGAPITPNAAMTDLVRRVGAAYPIISSGRDPVNANFWRVTTVVPVDDGPFDIREIGVWDAVGDMIAVGRHVLVEKRTPAQGAAVELMTDIVFPVSETAQVTVQVTPSAQISIFQMLRAGFTVVESATLADPPGAPLLGRTHVVPAGATGAWSGLAGYLVQWNGLVWVAVNVPDGFVVVDQSKGRYASNRWLERTAAGWDAGLTRLLQRQPGNYAVAAGTANALTIALDPAPTAWADLVGVPLHILLTATNTGAATLAIVGLPTGKPISLPPNFAVVSGDLRSGTIATFFFDGTQVQYVGSRPSVKTPLYYDANGALNVVPTKPLVPRAPVVLTSSGSYTFPEDGFYDQTLIGGGGGGSGGYGSGSFTVGGNGGGSGYVRRFTRFYAAGTTISFTIGAGGFEGTRNLGGAGALPGGDGGATTFDGVSAKGGKGATGAVLATVDTGVEGPGRNNGTHGNYLIGPDAASVQMVPGQGGRGYLDTVNDTVAYGEGGSGGRGANNLTYLADGVAGLSGAIVIE